jgi:hypothetical protein
MEELYKFLYNENKGFKLLTDNFPRIIDINIQHNNLTIKYVVGEQKVDMWIENYEKLDKILKQTYKHLDNDKQYYIKIVKE